MIVHLYIGQVKTGSSALQMFFHRNHRALLRRGVLYPMIVRPRTRVHDQLARAGVHHKDLNWREAHNALAFRMKSEALGTPVPPWHPNVPSSDALFDRLRRDIARHRPDMVVMVAEAFGEFGDHPGLSLAPLVRALAPYEVQVHATFRRPDLLLASWHGQRLRFDRKLPALRHAALAPYLNRALCDPQKMLAPWIDAFGAQALRIRNYDDLRQAGGSVAAFCAAIGIALDDGLVAPARTNASVPYALRILINRSFDSLSEAHRVRLIDWCLREAAQMDLPPDSAVELFGGLNRAMLVETYRPRAAYLGELSGKSPFFPDLEDMGLPRKLPELQAARAALPGLRARAAAAPPCARVKDYIESFDLDGGA
ncbi:hypothetical protein ACS3SW_05645 [Roseobacteraceae bacterium S113]